MPPRPSRRRKVVTEWIRAHFHGATRAQRAALVEDLVARLDSADARAYSARPEYRRDWSRGYRAGQYRRDPEAGASVPYMHGHAAGLRAEARGPAARSREGDSENS